MDNIEIKYNFTEHTKTYCVLGVLLSDNGINIEKDMLSWLINDYDVISVRQALPGKLFEYPAIQFAINLCKETNEPCLYIHTKGAANFSNFQKQIRNMWKDEFVNNKSKYDKVLNDNLNNSVIICPFTGPDKNTWFNGFFITPNAAKNTHELKIRTCRFYWESMYRSNNNVSIIGTLLNDIRDIKDKNNIHKLVNYIKENY